MAYQAETFHIAGAVMACKRMEAEGEDITKYYIPDIHANFPAGLTWCEFARALWDTEDLSVDTLAEAPYRVMIGTESVADDVGWIDVTPEDDKEGAEPDLATDYIS